MASYEVTVRVDGFHPASAQTYAGIVAPSRIDFHLTRVALQGRRQVQPRRPAGDSYEQVTSELPVADGDLVEGTD